ncbi:NAD-dependent epimerase/dehydratase family protein [Nocardia paucivorans]|uniref:NAD-dependent epimerase/dehydratase family protein n=1 Tax=Nocardia paucivorans TaxID=114259 RepID=UPI0002DF18F7|nr:NAD-dependent epimerase/dehydratase family protein [Nocardia paucivorans]
MNHVVVTGAAGFLGSHLCRALLDRGDRVTAIDNFSTGRTATIASLLGRPGFTLRTADITRLGAFADLDRVTHIAHLARPGSPVAAVRQPEAALRAASTGTLAALDLAAAHNARIVIASGTSARPRSSHPSRRWVTAASVHAAGNHLTESAARYYRNANIGIVRPFEVYGPHLWPDDGRVTALICAAALHGRTMRLGDRDRRAFVYVGDTVDAVLALLDTDTPGPIDLAGPAVPLVEFARIVFELTGRGRLETTSTTTAETIAASTGVTRTCAWFGRRPRTELPAGLRHTLDWMSTVLTRSNTVRHRRA